MLQPFLQQVIQSDPTRPRVIPNEQTGPANVVPGNNVGQDFTTLFSGDWWSWLFAATGIGAILAAIWSVYVILAYLFSILLLTLYVYASIRKKQYNELEEQRVRDAEAMYDQYYNRSAQPSRLSQVETHIESDNPNDWKLAIIEADIILDDILKERGYAGNSLGERLRSIQPAQLASLNDAWEAHKVRNQIAHEGADFVLTERMARETIQRYRRVFADFNVQ